MWRHRAPQQIARRFGRALGEDGPHPGDVLDPKSRPDVAEEEAPEERDIRQIGVSPRDGPRRVERGRRRGLESRAGGGLARIVGLRADAPLGIEFKSSLATLAAGDDYDGEDRVSDIGALVGRGGPCFEANTCLWPIASLWPICHDFGRPGVPQISDFCKSGRLVKHEKSETSVFVSFENDEITQQRRNYGPRSPGSRCGAGFRPLPARQAGRGFRFRARHPCRPLRCRRFPQPHRRSRRRRR